MRLPLRHAPPARDVPRLRCAYLESLVQHAVGLPLGAAARALTGGRSRGRHGVALQWHLGLDAHDTRAAPDWEGRIEVKLVSLWQRGEGVAADKVKVCEVGLDPTVKLGNVLWVFADRVTRVVVGHCFTVMSGRVRETLVAGWDADPHFEAAPIVLEQRRRVGEASAPAYYLQPSFLRDVGILPAHVPHGVLPFDTAWWRATRSAHAGRDPMWSVVVDRDRDTVGCPRCGATLHVDRARLATHGWSPATHAPSGSPHCLTHGHAAVDVDALPRPVACSREEQRAALCGTGDAHTLLRLADRVAEPEDHEH